MRVFDFWVILTIFQIISIHAKIIHSLNSTTTTCDSNDFDALVSFINSMNSSISNWNTTDSSNCCSWEGISCSNSSRVISLDLSFNKLSGFLSQSLSNLSQLKTLNLSGNALNDSIPSSIFDMPNLETLDLSSNEFSGPISGVLCSNSTRIRHLDLGWNYLTGDLPATIGNCSFLEHLCVSSNFMTGGVPGELFRLRKLESLNLQDNRFNGLIGDGIGNLSNLLRFDISMNNFTGVVPNVFRGFGKLVSFVANSNRFQGSIPTSISNSSTIRLLNLNNNSFTGKIDLDCVHMVSLVSLDLGSNEFNGSIPDYLPACKQLKNINLARNNFSGEIPDSFRKFSSLSYLSLSNASIYNISSALRILNDCKNLTTLVLTLNFGEEQLPADPNLRFEKLKVLIIANCGLSGFFPLWLRASTKLQLLDASWNYFSGNIPSWFGDFKNLFYLDLSNNSFTGEIPKSLTGLESLINRSIALEEPSPDFPFFMRRKNARGLQYNQVLSFPPTLDLGYNNLTGPIWPQFGNLKKLHFLELRNNSLSGSIPSELAGMRSLETLDLSYNNLSGIIPPSLVQLSFMSRFSVAYNNLQGRIPTGGQFQTFPNSSFKGNPGLCSEHTLPCESENQAPKNSPKKSETKKGTIIGMGVGIGFGTAFLLILMSVIVWRTQRRGEVDVENLEHDNDENCLNQLGSRLVLFQYKENSNELSIDELLKSTDNFDQANIIGCGGFGLVYKAILPDGRKVAIKKLSGDCGQVEREFQAEVEALSRAQHPNLVLLQGFCIYKNDRLLIYSYMVNGSLDYWLHEKHDGPSSLDWEARLHIARGSAKGLEYLHQSCNPHILHRDIKSSNILLDENFEAHLADFGLARLILSPYDTHVTTDLVGTLGYIPPEYGQASIATYKGDVYSFGVVLLELLTGKRPMDMCKPKGSRDMISWVIQMTKEKRETEVFDPFVYDKQHDKEMLRVLQIACLCLRECPKSRPSTSQLVSWLDEVGLVGV